MSDQLLKLFTSIQDSEGLNDTDFAMKLGIPRRTWGQTRTGQLPLSQAVISAFASGYAGLKGAILTAYWQFLMRGGK